MFHDRSPIYLQIADGIKNDVLSGALKEDDQVMSTNQYAAFYRINPATAAKGFAQLVDEGVLYKRRGIGMFVSPGARDMLLAERRTVFAERFVEPLLAEARKLGLTPADLIDLIHTRADGAPDRREGTTP